MCKSLQRRHGRRLNVSPLEARDVPAAFGVPWSDPTHLTLSFAPDGTSAAGVSSKLNGVLDAQMPNADWHAAILRAVQIWSSVANLNIGVVADSGDPFGSPGATQADPRFGDIRIAGVPMAGDALGEAVPPDPLLSGTMAGDVFFNTSTTFTAARLTSVALHELGHALGLAPSANPRSIMFNGFTGRETLSRADVIAIRSLYGTRLVDLAEGRRGNAAFPRATNIQFPAGYKGDTPLVAFGTLLGSRDVDTFQFKNLSDYSGPITLRAQTAGISTVPLRMSVYDQAHNLLGQLTGTGNEGGTVTFTLPDSQPGQTYYLRVDAAPGAITRIGRYGVAVTFDGELKPTGISIADVLRGPFDSLDANDLQKLFEDPNACLFREDHGSDDSENGATALPAVRGPFGLTRFTATGSMTDSGDADFYQVRAPRVSSRVTLTLVVSVRAIGANGVTPRVEVFDQFQNPVAAELLLNGAGHYAVQVKGAQSNRSYFVRVSGASSGNYALEATFRTRAVDLRSFASGSVTDTHPVQYKLYAGRTQLFGFALSASGPAGAAVRMVIKNQAGTTVFDLTANAGDTVSGLSTFLPPGEYTVQLTSVGTAQPAGFLIRGAVQTDPIGPQPGDSLLAPIYQDPSNSSQFLYPDGTVTIDPFLWVLILI